MLWRIDLDQLAQRILQAPADGDGAAQRGVEVGKLLPADRAGRVDAGPRFVDDDIGQLGQIVGGSSRNEFLGFPAAGAVADRHHGKLMPRDQVVEFGFGVLAPEVRTAISPVARGQWPPPLPGQPPAQGRKQKNRSGPEFARRSNRCCGSGRCRGLFFMLFLPIACCVRMDYRVFQVIAVLSSPPPCSRFGNRGRWPARGDPATGAAAANRRAVAGEDHDRVRFGLVGQLTADFPFQAGQNQPAQGVVRNNAQKLPMGRPIRRIRRYLLPLARNHGRRRLGTAWGGGAEALSRLSAKAFEAALLICWASKSISVLREQFPFRRRLPRHDAMRWDVPPAVP